MIQCITYVILRDMKLNQYLSAHRGEAGRLAKAVGCTTVFVRNVANGHRNGSTDFALAIERETNGAVTVADIRPISAELMRSAGYVKVTEERKAA